LFHWPERQDRIIRVVQTVLPTKYGTFDLLCYRDERARTEHLAAVSPLGLIGDAPLVRIHSECLTGEVLGSERCDCGPQLDLALERVAVRGGVVVYLRGHEGRGVGLASKLQAYALQDEGFDTVDAQLELGLPVDAREYSAAAAVLVDLGIRAVRILTNNPLKVEAMRAYGIRVVAVEPITAEPLPSNVAYLRTKRDRLRHTVVVPAGEQVGVPNDVLRRQSR
jgi:3,4-dihydroxy 2-butanone 4-phosphate synthase/GTP cyclohydrolase II